MKTGLKPIFRIEDSDISDIKEEKRTEEQNPQSNKIYKAPELVDITREQSFWDKAVPS